MKVIFTCDDFQNFPNFSGLIFDLIIDLTEP